MYPKAHYQFLQMIKLGYTEGWGVREKYFFFLCQKKFLNTSVQQSLIFFKFFLSAGRTDYEVFLPGCAMWNTDVEVLFFSSKIFFCLWKHSLPGRAAIPDTKYRIMGIPILGKGVSIVGRCTTRNLDICCTVTF